ncbi:phytoene dehydrogenase [Sphingobacteriaceae bacterium]|nr:phytoene dehydrogenase [Sphingobacteriaceae bacterium]
MKQKVSIVGSGIAGLASAIQLACAGYKVTVFEKNAYPGGKLSELKLGDYRFDKGPSLLTMPHLIEELQTLSGFDEPFSYRRLDILTHYFFEDGTALVASKSARDFAKEISTKLLEDEMAVTAHLKRSELYYKLTAGIFLEQSISRIKNFLNIKTVKALANIAKLNLSLTMNQQNSKTFRNKKTVQIFNRYATYNGSDPYKAPALLNIIPHLEFGMGAYLPEGGMHKITEYLFKMAEHSGVNFRFNESVEEIVLNGKNVEGIIANGKAYSSKIVISDVDIKVVYSKLLPIQYSPKKLLNQEKSSSAFVFYWGINKEFSQLDIHNILFSENYEEEFRCLFQEDRPFSDPTIYINITSKANKNDAPGASENWFVMVNVPHNKSGSTILYKEELRKNIIAKINRILKTDIEKYIVVEDTLDPQSIEVNTSSFGGSLYGNASNNKYSAFFRHPNFSRQIKGLYFVGGSVHPGGGIPLCLLSAKIASGMILKEHHA